MRDKYSQERILKLHPKVKDTFEAFINECEETHDITLRITQGLRTFDEQQKLYNQGRSAPGKIVTNSQAGQSYHNYGLAIDLVRMSDTGADWSYSMKALKPIADKHGLVWGGSFKTISDGPHFEKSFGFTWRQLLEMKNTHKVDASGYVLI